MSQFKKHVVDFFNNFSSERDTILSHAISMAIPIEHPNKILVSPFLIHIFFYFFLFIFLPFFFLPYFPLPSFLGFFFSPTILYFIYFTFFLLYFHFFLFFVFPLISLICFFLSFFSLSPHKWISESHPILVSLPYINETGWLRQPP